MLRAQGNFVNTAYNEAPRHSLFNVDDLFPGERNNFDFSTLAGPSDGMVGAPGNGNIVAIPLTKGDKLYTGKHAWKNETITQWPIEIGEEVTRHLPWTVDKAGNGTRHWQCADVDPADVVPHLHAGPARVEAAEDRAALHLRVEGDARSSRPRPCSSTGSSGRRRYRG